MTDETRKLLTEYLGECWHEPINETLCSCGREDLHNAYIHSLNMNRTFTTAADLHALHRKIYEKGEWEEFWTFSEKLQYRKLGNAFHTKGIDEYYSSQNAWLSCLDGGYERGCQLVSEWLKEQKKVTPVKSNTYYDSDRPSDEQMEHYKRGGR